MPLEFALRPRIRLRDDFAAPPRRSRFRFPRLALPVLGYWLAIGGISYGLVHAHDSTDTAPLADGPSVPAEPQADVSAPVLPSEPAPAPVVAALAPLTTSEPAQDEPTENEPAEGEPTPPSAPTEPPVSDAPQPRSRLAPVRRSHAAVPSEERIIEHPPARPQSTLSEDDIAPLSAPFPALEAPNASALEPSSPRVRDSGRSGGSLPSCEAAAAAATQDLDFASSDRSADLPSSAIAGVLENGAWLSSCGVPASTSLEVCVAIKAGRVTAATVVSRPASSALNACVKQRAAALQFPYSPRVDIARTRF